MNWKHHRLTTHYMYFIDSIMYNIYIYSIDIVIYQLLNICNYSIPISKPIITKHVTFLRVKCLRQKLRGEVSQPRRPAHPDHPRSMGITVTG